MNTPTQPPFIFIEMFPSARLGYNRKKNVLSSFLYPAARYNNNAKHMVYIFHKRP